LGYFEIPVIKGAVKKEKYLCFDFFFVSLQKKRVMSIVYNLKKFFSEQQDEAAIPGLGVFFKVATDETGNTLPDGESVILFIEKTPRSNAFVNFLGYEENLTENEAIEVIENWVSSILNDLKTKKIADIPELGRFEIKKDKVIFIPAADQNFLYQLPSEYGLEDLPRPKVSERKPAPKKQSANSFVLWSIVGAIVIILIGGGIACYKTVPSFERFVNNLTGSVAQKQTAKPIVLAPPIADIDEPLDDEDVPETPKKESEIVSKAEVISSEQSTKPAVKETSQLPFKVIGGAFAIKANADRFGAQMKREGYEVDVIFDRQKQLYMVSLGAFETMTKALEFKEDIRKTKDIGCWVYRK
jgi:hypothetical protein